ncbi:Predicted phosphoesterase [Ruminococcaceae bacterium YRB3002]|nr:Predicted phosphoesterase [Ruminococcaceae bacterium YRB3002]
MKILAVADIEDRILYDHFTKERVAGVELIVACGDLKADYLDFLMTMVNVPMIYVRGNHDDEFMLEPPLGADCIENKIFKYKGIRFLGLGGCIRYKYDAMNMFTENEMKMRIVRATPKIMLAGGFDVLVTHAPAKGYGDMPGSHTHEGFQCFNYLMNKYQPAYMLHGHVHNNYGIVKMESEHPSGTKIVNCCGYKIIDIPEKKE